MKKEELIEKIAALSLSLAIKTTAYRGDTLSEDPSQNAEQLRLEIKELQNEISELNEQLTILIAAEPTNGKNI
ncbi:MAG: hypothetical protein ABUT20_21740 [Bacteroidota bacterium]